VSSIDDKNSNTLPNFLRRCVGEGIVDIDTARQIDCLRRNMEIGMTNPLEQLGLTHLTRGEIRELVEALKLKNAYAPILINCGPNPRLTFDTFVPSKRNELASEIAIKLAGGSGPSPYSPFYVFSDVGLGKTHLLSAMANKRGNDKALLVNTVELEAEHERACHLGYRADLMAWFEKAKMLLIDDIQLCEGNVLLQQELFSLINQMNRRGQTVVISSDVPPTRLKNVESRLLSRLGSGVIAGLVMPGKEARAEIVRRLVGKNCFPDDVVDYLSEHVNDNVRHLKAAVKQLLAMREHGTTEIEVDLARAIVPLPEDLRHTSTIPPGPRSVDGGSAIGVGATSSGDQFKEMLAAAETREEQILALQIALGARLGELKNSGQSPGERARLEKALKLLRAGKQEEALACIN
jgi:hypothetical protein